MWCCVVWCGVCAFRGAFANMNLEHASSATTTRNTLLGALDGGSNAKQQCARSRQAISRSIECTVGSFLVLSLLYINSIYITIHSVNQSINLSIKRARRPSRGRGCEGSTPNAFGGPPSGTKTRAAAPVHICVGVCVDKSPCVSTPPPHTYMPTQTYRYTHIHTHPNLHTPELTASALTRPPA